MKSVRDGIPKRNVCLQYKNRALPFITRAENHVRCSYLLTILSTVGRCLLVGMFSTIDRPVVRLQLS